MRAWKWTLVFLLLSEQWVFGVASFAAIPVERVDALRNRGGEAELVNIPVPDRIAIDDVASDWRRTHYKLAPRFWCQGHAVENTRGSTAINNFFSRVKGDGFSLRQYREKVWLTRFRPPR